jgi:protoporphyrinogen oxidase
MSESDYDLVVIGGGISGLGFAHFANQHGLKTLLLEASDQVGGCIRSHQFDTPDGPFWAELGAHTCYNSYGNLLQILEETKQLDKLQAKQKLGYQIQTPDERKSIPAELNYWELLGVIPRLLMAKKTGPYSRRLFCSHHW